MERLRPSSWCVAGVLAVSMFTEMRLKNGTKVPICGVLYQGYFDGRSTPAGEGPRGLNNEGVPVLDPKYYGGPATPTAVPMIRLYWP